MYRIDGTFQGNRIDRGTNTEQIENGGLCQSMQQAGASVEIKRKALTRVNTPEWRV